MRDRRPTSTSEFGVGRRESHNADAFYARFNKPLLSEDEDVVAPLEVDRIWCHDATDMDGRVADKSVALVVTSPPYFAGKAYELALGEGGIPADYDAYLQMLYDVFKQCWNKLEPGGRIAVNVANLGRKPYRSLSADVIDILDQLGYLLRGEVIWRKGQAAAGSCAWGTFLQPGNPVLRDVTERIVIASKGRFDRAIPFKRRAELGLPNESSIATDEFLGATLDVWDFPPESATRVGHPAPFPVELPSRLIELLTYRGDLVLDPFMGSGTTAVAAVRTGRHYIGFDTDPDYVRLASERAGGETVAAPPPREKAADLAARLLCDAGFTDVEKAPKLTGLGVPVTFRACDRAGSTWLFEVAGGFSVTNPGLRRADTVWRSLGKAASLAGARAASPSRRDIGPLVILTTDLPPPKSALGRALAQACGPDAIVRDTVLLDESALERLRQLAAG